MVQASPPQRSASSSSEFPRRRIKKKRTEYSSSAEAINKLQRAQSIENQLIVALDSLQQAIALDRSMAPSHVAGLLFPSIRECNSALATFGDSGELLRALRLFMKMRKAALLEKHFLNKGARSWPVPSPTLVTYSTIMSRANRMGKPRVALRMWNLMLKTPEFVYSRDRKFSPALLRSNEIVPDIKAANILMNSYAKLADVDAAQDLLNQMRLGNGTDVPRLEPNLVTYNTVLDACHKAGDLDAALGTMEQLERSGLQPDAWSYTSLIATVARKPSAASGVNDPSLAFSFLDEMTERNIEPNGMTYSALIDACGRCRRGDLALQGLRIMLRQKASVQQYLITGKNNKDSSIRSNYKGKPENYSLSNEVGAWTAAINALGKEGRIEAAMRLFFSMPNFGVQPNTVTCGCLTDSLLKHGRAAETLRVLRYMEQNGIVPSEVMYTSLITSAGTLARQEKNSHELLTKSSVREVNTGKANTKTNSNIPPMCSAIEVYTSLMKSLVEEEKSSSSSDSQEAKAHALMKVFLVFQEMKEAGAQPDLACYNAMLRACARAGDISRAQSVLRQLESDALEPNDTSWRQLIRAAGNAKRCDIVISTWKMAMSYSHDIKGRLGGSSSQMRSSFWVPSIETFSAMISALLRNADNPNLSALERRRVYQWIVVMYQRVLSGNKDDQLGMHRVDLTELFEDSRAMLLILQAIVSMDELTPTDGSNPNAWSEKAQLRQLATHILELESLSGITEKQRLKRSLYRCYMIAQSWAEDTSYTDLRP